MANDLLKGDTNAAYAFTHTYKHLIWPLAIAENKPIQRRIYEEALSTLQILWTNRFKDEYYTYNPSTLHDITLSMVLDFDYDLMEKLGGFPWLHSKEQRIYEGLSRGPYAYEVMVRGYLIEQIEQLRDRIGSIRGRAGEYESLSRRYENEGIKISSDQFAKAEKDKTLFGVFHAAYQFPAIDKDTEMEKIINKVLYPK